MCSKTLSYEIHDWSSYSSNYHPRNILVDKPNDQMSRWSSDSNHSPQFVTVKLPRPAVVMNVTFGKYEKGHVCNIKKFVIYGGTSESQMIEILNGGLNNDSKKETFTLRHKIQGKCFPCKFIKVVPILSHGTNFNFSIWYLSFSGIDEPDYVKPRLKWFADYKEQEVVRLCLKHFRQKNYLEAFEALQKKSKVLLEDPLLTQLHTALVQHGDFEKVEEIIESSAKNNLFNQNISSQSYIAKWSPIYPIDENGHRSHIQPGPRGGHQMCIDVEKQLIFLLGGWDGTKELSDFWMYDITNCRWHCISEDMAADGGPSARSCHKFCIDTRRRDLYLLGRFLDACTRGTVELKSDFYKYDLDTGLWEVVSKDTFKDGGPHLIFDHQMLYDNVSDKLFVFGGRILTSTHDDGTFDPRFSGLFSYHIESKTWTKIRDDASPSSNIMRARSGHSMLIDDVKRKLYIFAGQRGNKEYLSDFFSYDIENGEVENILVTLADNTFPSGGFTQRATIDVSTNEIFMLSGLSKEDKKEEIRNSFWVCDMSNHKWSCVYRNENTGQSYWEKMQSVEPRPRFAHQLVYDPLNKVHFLFGGNPGRTVLKTRLDDFWMLKMHRQNLKDLLRQCKYMIRKLRYKELTNKDSIEALKYLQGNVSEVVDHNDETERNEFETLATSLFLYDDHSPSSASPISSDDDEGENGEKTKDKGDTPRHIYKSRTAVFDQLVLFFPQEMVQPSGTLTEFVHL